MLYADFKYYKETYKGTLTEDSFDSLILKASREIDKNINTRLTEIKINNLPNEAQEQLKYTACALTDLINKKEVEVTKIRNLGKKSLKEVLDKVEEMGLKFRD